jgi:hypothetical protein
MKRHAGPFAIWLNKMWHDHRIEVLRETGVPTDYNLQEYFVKYKWWLRREYKFQKKTS